MSRKFNWSLFLNKKIAVNCQSEEECMNFLQECEKRGLKWCNGDIATNFQEYKHYGRETCIDYEQGRGIGFADRGYFDEEEANMKIVKWSYMIEKEVETEKTFREVIADIKEGEVWESNDLIIMKFSNNLEINWKDGVDDDGVMIFDSETFRLQRKQYSFEEAINKSLNEGKEIESCESCLLVKIYNGGIKYRYSNISDIWQCTDSFEPVFSINEIQGRWYINN